MVGTGAGTRTGALFAAAVAKGQGGVITFDCGGAATIPLTAETVPPKTPDTIIDGGGVITLDGQHQTRLLHFDGGNYRTTMTTITLQNIKLVNGKASGTGDPRGDGAVLAGHHMIDGGGGAVLVRDGILHVIDSDFEDNDAAELGPDVAGGAINGQGALNVVVTGTTFKNNTASNGGAIGTLNTTLTLANCLFDGNKANGNGGNTVDKTKCAVGGGEIGNGGDGGAVSQDGGDDLDVVVCGTVFQNHTAGATGTYFRVCDGTARDTTFDRSTFAGNTAKTAGGLYVHNVTATVTASTFSGNTAQGAGGFRGESTTVAFTNVTFADNTATKGLGGAMALYGNGGTLLNCTFSGNTSTGGSGYFAAAIAGNTALTIDNTVFSGNTDMDCGSGMACFDGSSTGAANLQWPQKHVVCTNDDGACATGTTFADAMLGALADNGGPTQTILPATGGPAAGSGKACPATDQRGKPRKQPDGCTSRARWSCRRGRVPKEKARPGETLIARNTRASFDYDLGDRFEAGLVLKGSEVKMLRAGKANLTDAFCTVFRSEAYLEGMSIGAMTDAAFGHRPKGIRKLLLHRREILLIGLAIGREGMTAVATRLYFKGGRAKVEIALARGKKTYDKRATTRTRDAEREARAVVVHGQRRYGRA